MRVYALYSRNKWILICVGFEALVAMGIGCVSTVPAMSPRSSYANFYSGLSLDRSQIPAQAYLKGESLLHLKFVTCHEHYFFTSRGKLASRQTICMSIITPLPPRSNGGGLRRSTGFGFHRLCTFYVPFDKDRDTQRTTCTQTLCGRYVRDTHAVQGPDARYFRLSVLWVRGCSFWRDTHAKISISVTWSANLANIIFLLVRFTSCSVSFQANRSYLTTLPESTREPHLFSAIGSLSHSRSIGNVSVPWNWLLRSLQTCMFPEPLLHNANKYPIDCR